MQPVELVRRACPGARTEYLASIRTGEAHFARFGLVGRARMIDFLAQICHETDGLTICTESMNYSADRLPQVWPSRFGDPAVARHYAHASEALAEHVYGGRMGNGPEGSGDGWRYVGHGLLQITGREAYERYGRVLDIPLADQPDLAVSAEWALAIAAAEWAASSYHGKTCNELADADDFEGETRAINGGVTGLSSRLVWRAKLARIVDGAPLDLPAASGPTPAAPAGPDHSVSALQEALNRLTGAGLGVDGDFGPRTRAAVVAYQRARGLRADGIAGPATWATLDAALAA